MSWNKNKLLVAATAIIFSVGCHAVCKIFLLKSKQSTVISSFLRLPWEHTFLGLRTVFGLATSREDSKVTSFFVVLSNTLKKLLYEPVIIAVSLPFQQHSNLSNMQSFSYSEHSFALKYSCTWKIIILNLNNRLNNIRRRQLTHKMHF